MTVTSPGVNHPGGPRVTTDSPEGADPPHRYTGTVGSEPYVPP